MDAVVRNLIVIGEAAVHVPEDICRKHPEVPWYEMRGFGGSDQANGLIRQQNDEKTGLIISLGRCFCHGNKPFKNGILKYQGIGVIIPGCLAFHPLPA